MSTLQRLQKMMGGKKLPMISDRRRGGNGIPYTEREIRCASFIGRLVLNLAGTEVVNPVTDKELNSNADFIMISRILQLLVEDNGVLDAAQAIRTVYRDFESRMLRDDDSYEDFPIVDEFGTRQPRKQSSHTVLFRTALRKQVSKEVLDRMFKLYPAGKKKAG